MNKPVGHYYLEETIKAALNEAGMPNCIINAGSRLGSQEKDELTLDARIYKFPLLKWTINNKNHVGEPQAIKFIEKINNPNTVIIADKIEPKAKAIFRNQGISYLDSSADLYLKGDGLLIFFSNIPKKKPTSEINKPLYSKAWVKLFLLFLCNSTATTWTQRQIAAGAGLGLGTVSQLLKAESKLINQITKIHLTKDYEVISDLLDRWADIYIRNGIGQKLLGTFEMPLINSIDNYSQCAWSGEIGNHLFTINMDDKHFNSKSLIPESGILYTRLPIYEVMRLMQLIPNPNGNLKVFSQPWNETLNANGLASMPIIYADLLKGDSRSINEAKKIETYYLSSII